MIPSVTGGGSESSKRNREHVSTWVHTGVQASRFCIVYKISEDKCSLIVVISDRLHTAKQNHQDEKELVLLVVIMTL